jgi:transcriptional regulator with XRE-family HTH domain
MEGFIPTGERLREKRKAENTTQFTLAIEMGLMPQMISAIETGINFPLHGDAAEKIAAYLEMDFTEYQHITRISKIIASAEKAGFESQHR